MFTSLLLAAVAAGPAPFAQHAAHPAPTPPPADPHAGHAMPPAPAQATPTDPHAGHRSTPPATGPHIGHRMAPVATQPADPDPHAAHRSSGSPAPATDLHAGHATQATVDHGAMDHGAMGHGGMRMSDAGAAYGSGTALLPLAGGTMTGAHAATGGWSLMAHGYAWVVTTEQSGPRGDDMSFVQSMGMLMADHDLSDTTHLQLRAMMSLEPLMSRRGYPNLLATGETAFGVPLVDRQHPHDLFMELAARLEVAIGDNSRLILYGGPVGEPALGPAAFMHRVSARYLPLAPITHHWFDSTHITYGVATAGWRTRTWQIEGSVFTGREPDEERWNLDTPRFDSWSVRASWTPSPNLVAQFSHARLKEPEAQHPGEDERRTTASVHYATPRISATVAWSLKDRVPGEQLPAWLVEANWSAGGGHNLFARGERVSNDELFPDHDDPLHDRTFRVARGELGYAYRLSLAEPLNLALGGSAFATAVPRAIERTYGDGLGWSLFAKLTLGDIGAR
ncbi:hypothetical protein SAMN06297144_0039 [Sphingomonas guangdongensis]|uniref:Beta-barrel porin-2, OmpL-like. bbp2 n=1 Tax=Sphingomonas guangdongensis TaxID=1141890 RepID=A0A285QAL9_9SPHN|nr:hypothetical protein [Sphingomonas guangdongensis]SOB78534.1 hypothetical protein SAMN06297144_0039 [Sphingomonas guangdongensis]